MARQRKYLLPVAAVLLGILGNRPVAAETPDILPPSPFAVEMPADTTTLSIGNLPIRDILARIKAGGDRVTMDLPRERIGPGAWRVLLSAWDPEMRDRPVARREAVLFVLPHGMTPVGATGVGGGAEIARDDSGFVHMVWTDDWRPGARPGAMYRRGRVLPDGGVQFDTDIVDLAQQHKGNFTAEPALAAAGDTVHFIWQAEGTIWYRSLHKAGDSWRWSDEVDTKAPARDQGAAIAADPTAVHILTVDGKYLTSRDGGRSWSTEAVPFGTFARLGSVSLTLDATGRPLAAASVLVSEAGPPAVAPDGGGQGARGKGASGQGARGSGAGGQDAGGGEATRAGVAPVAAAGAKGARWTVRLARRIGNGAWQVLPGPPDGRPEWTSPERPDQDVLCASFRVREDAGGAMYATWDGTPAGRAETGFQAFYAWRPAGGGWSPPIALATPDPVHGLSKSFATGLILNGDAAVPLVTLDQHSGWRYRGSDAEMRLFHGAAARAPALPLTSFIRDAMTANEPAEALSTDAPTPVDTLLHTDDGRFWADIVMTLSATRANAPALIVWRHLDVTDWRRAVGQ